MPPERWRSLQTADGMVPELGAPAIRELLIGNYRLIYEVGSSRVVVLALIHGARDLAALWEREGRPR